MTTNRKGRSDWHQVTLKTSKSTFNSTGLGPCVKGCIVTLALWGWLPLGLTDQLTHRGGTRDA